MRRLQRETVVTVRIVVSEVRHRRQPVSLPTSSGAVLWTIERRVLKNKMMNE